MALRAYQESPGGATCLYAAKRPQTISVARRWFAGALLLGVKECGRRAQQRQKVPALRWQSQALCRSGPIEGH
jgi:hypothetical protein